MNIYFRKCPGSIFEQEGIDLTFYRSPSLERVEFLTVSFTLRLHFTCVSHMYTNSNQNNYRLSFVTVFSFARAIRMLQ